MKKVSKKSKRRLLTFGTISIFAIGYFFVTFFGYLYSYVSLKNEEIVLKQNLNYLQKRKQNLKIEIQKLNDPEYIARYAKEKFLYSSDGEYVLKLNDDIEEVEQIAVNDNSIYIIIISGIITLAIILIIAKNRSLKKVSDMYIENNPKIIN